MYGSLVAAANEVVHINPSRKTNASCPASQHFQHCALACLPRHAVPDQPPQHRTKTQFSLSFCSHTQVQVAVITAITVATIAIAIAANAAVLVAVGIVFWSNTRE